MAVSISCPMAVTTGTGQSAMAVASPSWSNQERSAREPPPRVMTITSRPSADQAAQRRHDLRLHARPLHPAIRPPHGKAASGGRQPAEEVALGGAARRGDQADAQRQLRQRQGAVACEQPLPLQPREHFPPPRFETSQGELPVHADDLERQLAVRRVEVDHALQADLQPVGKTQVGVAAVEVATETEPLPVPAEDRGGDLESGRGAGRARPGAVRSRRAGGEPRRSADAAPRPAPRPAPGTRRAARTGWSD